MPDLSHIGGHLSVRKLDSVTTPYYYRARYYDSTTGRFISEDPAQFAGGGTNFYAYVKNRLTNLIDPFGLRPGDKYASLQCAGWQAIWDFNTLSRHQNLEYGGFVYRNPDGTFSYTDPHAAGNSGIGTRDSIPNFWNIPIPAGTNRVGWYHTHGAYDPGINLTDNTPGGPSYNWHLDLNEVFSKSDRDISDYIHGPGFLGTPRGTTEMYTPKPGQPERGHVRVLSVTPCECEKQ